MKVALLTDGIWPYVIGGMQKHSYFLCKYLAQNGVDVLLVHTAPQITDDLKSLSCFSEGEKKFITSVIVNKPKVLSFPGHYIYQSYLFSKRIYDTLGGFPDVDIIIAKSMTGWYFLKKGTNNSPPVAINIHGYEFLQKQANLKMALQSLVIGLPMKWINRNADYVFSYGGKITNFIKQIGVPMNKIIEVPAAIESEWVGSEVKATESATRHFLFIGRYERRKGTEELHEVIRSLADRYKFSFVFVGPIPEDKRFKQPNVKYCGVVREKEALKNLLRGADVLVCPSYAEGMPNVILEGMANGCSVIATDVGAVSLMVNKDNGWLIPPADKNALKEAIIKAMELDKGEMDRKKYAAIKLVEERYLWEKNIYCLLDKLQSVIRLRSNVINSDETNN